LVSEKALDQIKRLEWVSNTSPIRREIILSAIVVGQWLCPTLGTIRKLDSYPVENQKDSRLIAEFIKGFQGESESESI
jgi:hypothetical protein